MNKNIKLWIILLFVIILFNSSACKEREIAMNEIINLPPLKDQFRDFFIIGNIFNPIDVAGGAFLNEKLLRHYNVLTAENHMKPNALSGAVRGQYNWTTADNMVNTALAAGFKVVGHTLLWHSQIPTWQQNLRTDNTTPAATVLEWMKTYITDVVTRYKGKVYLWDVLNEVFPDPPQGGYASSSWRDVMRRDTNNGNPWYIKIGADFVYEGFKAARLADPDAILYYNDYNLNMPVKALMVHNMVRDINEQWKNDPAYDEKKLIQGIGMQSHHNTSVPASQIRDSLTLFKPLGVEIAISELDVLAQSFQQFQQSGGEGPRKHSQTTVTAQGLETQARLYGEYFTVFLEFADIIERVTFWGLTDDLSWRSVGLPLPFDPQGVAKPAYFKIIEALEEFKAR